MILEQPKPQDNLKPIKFELLNKNFIKQIDDCLAVSFNADYSIVAAGCHRLIKIYEFRQGILKEIQILNQRNSGVSTLYFMRKSNQFISGDMKGSIFLWARNHVNQWTCSYRDNQHNVNINYLIMNNNEDTMISSSDYKTKYQTKQMGL
ncbi:unnamed protein product [Paramecium octaurelia]|uniref:Uncharacterized protein n=1 Tax=Paramecium octaurelia TaxID=43137 RepID=A0A8S1W6S3_PAROT|nr:unnamed protein product [Paramecium octaurelia]